MAAKASDMNSAERADSFIESEAAPPVGWFQRLTAGIRATLTAMDGGQRRHLDTAKPKFVYSEDYPREYPHGWPRLAEIQDRFSNRPLYRRFGGLMQRALLEKQSQIHQADRKLAELAMRDAANGDFRLRGMSKFRFDPHGTAGSHTAAGDEQQVLLDWATQQLLEYFKLLRADHELRAWPSVTRDEHLRMWESMTYHKDGPILDDEAMEAMLAADDFVTTRTERAYRPVGSFFSGYPASWLLTILGSHEKDGPTLLSTDRLRALFKTLAMLCIPALIFVPMAPLYLAELSKQASFGIVVGAMCLFSWSLTFFLDLRAMNNIVVQCAYGAILATVLAQLGGSCPGP